MIRTKKGFLLRKAADSYIIIAIGEASRNFRDILETNETGAFYWSLLEKGTTVEEMTKASMNRFDGLDEETAREDIDEFLNNIKDAVENI